jgi:hypothetical protein
MCWVWESKDREESQCPHGSTVSSTSWEGDIWSCKSATRLINRMLLRLFCPDKGQTGQFIGGLFMRAHACESTTNGKIPPNPYPNPELKCT